MESSQLAMKRLNAKHWLSYLNLTCRFY